MEENKGLANWIYWEDAIFYCSDCIEKRLKEINDNKEFSEDINYKGGDECGYYQDIADEDNEVYCCKCNKPLQSRIDCH